MRMRDADEPRPGVPSTRKGLTIHCKRCFKAGHNSRFCNYPIHPKSKFYKEPEKKNDVDASDNTTSILEVVTDGNVVGRKRPLGAASSSSQPKKTKQVASGFNSEPPPPPHSTVFNVPTPALNLKELEKKKANDGIVAAKKGKVTGVSSSSQPLPKKNRGASSSSLQPPPPSPLHSTVSNSELPPQSTVLNVPTPTQNVKEIGKKKVNDGIMAGKKGKVSDVSSSSQPLPMKNKGASSSSSQFPPPLHSTVISVPNSIPNEATNSSSVCQPCHRGRSTAPTISSVLKQLVLEESKSVFNKY